MKQVVFNGLGPKESVSYGGKLVKNGGTVMMEESHAEAYIKAGVAFYPQSEAEITAVQKLEIKNAATRKRVVEKAKESEK